MNENAIIEDNVNPQNDSDVLGVYAFYDEEAGRHDTPFYCQNDIFAQRHYKMVVGKEGTMINQFSESFSVKRLGYFHLITGKFTLSESVIIDPKKFVKKED